MLILNCVIFYNTLLSAIQYTYELRNIPFNFDVYLNGPQSETPCSFNVPIRLLKYKPLMRLLCPYQAVGMQTFDSPLVYLSCAWNAHIYCPHCVPMSFEV